MSTDLAAIEAALAGETMGKLLSRLLLAYVKGGAK